MCVMSSLIDLLPRKRVHVFGISCRKTNGMDWTQTQLGNGLGSLFIRLPTSTLWTLEKWRHKISGALGSSLHRHHRGRRHEQGHGLPQRSAPPDQHQPNRHCPLATGPPFSYLNPLAAGRLDHAHRVAGGSAPARAQLLKQHPAQHIQVTFGWPKKREKRHCFIETLRLIS